MCKDEHWVYGDLRHYNRNPHTEKWTIHDPEIGLETDVDENTIGQFTGLYDKNGKEIYEGDILKYTRTNFKSGHLKKEKIEEIYDVFWNESKHAFYCHTEFESGGGASGFLSFKDERAEKNEIEIVGNRFDNPELLKGGENGR